MNTSGAQVLITQKLLKAAISTGRGDEESRRWCLVACHTLWRDDERDEGDGRGETQLGIQHLG